MTRITLLVFFVCFFKLYIQSQISLGGLIRQGEKELSMYQYAPSDCQTNESPIFYLKYSFPRGIESNSNRWMEWKMDYIDCNRNKHIQIFYAPLYSDKLLKEKCITMLPPMHQAFDFDSECIYPKEMKNLSQFISEPYDIKEFVSKDFDPTLSKAKNSTDDNIVIDLGDFVKVEGGTFLMGSPSSGQNRGDDERQHEVTVSTFYMQATEVTQAMYESIMGVNPSASKGPSKPVTNVSWNDSQEFIKKLNAKEGGRYRLPTEAEWEYAARGGNRSKDFLYSGANDLNRVGWYDGNSGGQTQEVKGKRPNELGIYDLSGNVWEWCADWYGEYSNNVTVNPKGPANGQYRILRGGAWRNIAQNCRVAYRINLYPEIGSYSYGFRLVFSE